MAIFSTILAVLKAIPILHEWFKSFVKWYSEKERQWFYESVAKGVVDAIEKRDQRDLEKAVGSPKAGKPSGHEGVEFENVP